jgi:hypothetical protein
MSVTRAEHLAWCKTRALEYLDEGDVVNAITSMMSDMDKHPDTALGRSPLFWLGLTYATGARRWIEGFH